MIFTRPVYHMSVFFGVLNNSTSRFKIDSLSNVISIIYCTTLGLNETEIQGRTLQELGGDSMMAINMTHAILTDIQKMGHTLPDEHKITPMDILQLSTENVLKILESGRNKDMPPTKKKRVEEILYENENIESLPSYAIEFDKSSDKDKSSVISKTWKFQLSMCVDSTPLLIDKGTDYVIISGSQGGDLACINSSGKLLSRIKVKGKNEGDLSHAYLSAPSADVKIPIIFIPTYIPIGVFQGESSTVSGTNSRSCAGYVHAMKLSETNNLEPIWTYTAKGEIKSKPAVFAFSSRNSSAKYHRLLVASYDGCLSYLDASTGDLLDKNENLGGALHVDPILCTNNTSDTESEHIVSAVVASCTWKGKVTCLKLTEDSMTAIWEMDLWTPIYATPYARNGQKPAIIICGVDGTVRALRCDNGEEIWKTEAGNKPIFKKCTGFDPGRDGNTNESEHSRQIIVGANDGKIRFLRESDGAIQRTIDVNAPILSSPIVTESGKIVCATTAGNVRVFDCKPPNAGATSIIDDTHAFTKTNEEQMSSICLDGEIFSNPQMKGNDIFVGCRDSCVYKLQVMVPNK